MTSTINFRLYSTIFSIHLFLCATSCDYKSGNIKYYDKSYTGSDITNTLAKESFLKGQDYFANGKYREAKSSFLLANNQQPNNPTILNAIGNSIYRIKSTENADTYFLKAMSIDSSFMPTYSNYGAYLNTIKEYEKAIEIFRLGLKKNKIPPDVKRALHLNLANSYYFLKDKNHALQLLDSAKKGSTDEMLIKRIEKFKKQIEATILKAT